VPDFCTCGAQLPPDARFCHKCAKPQRDEPWIAEAETTPPPPPPVLPVAPPAPPPINFRNPLAVRIGFLGAMLASLMNLLLIYGYPIWLIAAGVLCVYVYRSRTGQALTVGDGARIGLITGLFSFAVNALIFTFGFVEGIRSGELLERAARVSLFPVNPEQLRQFLENPFNVASAIVFGLVILFVVFTLLSVAGGALGAKVMGK